MHEQVLTAATSTGNGTAVSHEGGNLFFAVAGLGTGAVKVQYTPDGTNWIDTGISSTDSNFDSGHVPVGQIRTQINTASSTGINAWFIT